jgi:uncharacterized membrane protein
MLKDFFTAEEQLAIVNAIKEAETNTSGEVRVHIDKTCKEDVLDRAAYWFAKLDMHKTELRNGVLFYLATADHKFAILGDAGINAKVPADFWDETKNLMLSHVKEGRYSQGLIEGILMSGAQLKAHFPYQKNDTNELSDELSFGKH